MTKVTVKPPDGGWGWIVVSAAFLIHLIADGVIYSFGGFFLEFTKHFKRSESTTAWIGSALTAMPLLTGPIAASLTTQFGCRKVTIVGGMLATCGFVLASFSTSTFALILTFGVVPGFGLSLCYVAALDIVAHYFDKRRSFAMGLAVCGGGVGTFFFAPITQRFIVWYGWEMTTALLSVSFLVISLCGYTMKSLKSSAPKLLNQPERINLNLIDKGLIHKSISTVSLPTLGVDKDQEKNNFKRSYSYNQRIDKSKSFDVVNSNSPPIEAGKKDAKIEDENASIKLPTVYEIVFTLIKVKLLDTRDSLKNTRFLLFVLSNCLLYTWYDVPYVYIQIAAVHQGYSDQLSSLLISSIGLANLVGNIILGYLGDKKWIRPTLLYAVCVMISGGSIVLLPICLQWNVWAVFIICAAFGATIAANCALTPVILVKLVSLERFANGYGLLLFLQGIGNLVGPPVAGLISDRMGSPNLSFIFAGVGIFVSSLLLLSPIFYKDKETEQQHQQQEEQPFPSEHNDDDNASQDANTGSTAEFV